MRAWQAGLGLRDEEGGGSGASLLDGVSHIGEDGKAKVLLAGLLGIRSADNVGSCVAEKRVR